MADVPTLSTRSPGVKDYDGGVSTDVLPGSGKLPELTGDARVDRWREHRATVRAEIIEATLRAIEENGPDVSIDDILKAAGVSRPKLYRFFDDKDALFYAVAERLQEIVIERITPHLTLSGTLRDFVRSSLVAYVDLVDARPNTLRFLIGSHFTDGRSPASLIDSGRPLADAMVEFLAGVIRMYGGNGENLQYAVDAMLGAVSLGVLRWVNEPTIPKDALVEELTMLVWGAFAAATAARGVILDPEGRVLSVPVSD
ncbi:TetR/AcrR family transcriptional regulator [Mycobacterium sp. CBMA271]|uniref:TetR/AcrR family transcriptional regulator n=1 Tax=unclassified Mycobacteroides TaxID=2618759 RepID=UPI0012DBE6EF|nr:MULTISPECIES: TetR/AcrR family transcriptional regulator [unclassified Mycobacteroides]MUM21055.1 TetR/AcrR family transcriptional regulator [Mycobacteroides sp. CBMA 271]